MNKILRSTKFMYDNFYDKIRDDKTQTFIIPLSRFLHKIWQIWKGHFFAELNYKSTILLILLSVLERFVRADNEVTFSIKMC